jgi:hypothetical protein
MTERTIAELVQNYEATHRQQLSAFYDKLASRR